MNIQVFLPKFDVDSCLAQIKECLERGWTGMGFKTLEFENAWKEYTGHNNAFFLNSATAGLNMAVEILKTDGKWNDEDEIITTPLTFISTNHAILSAKLHPVFADIDETFCLSPASVLEHITNRTKAVVFVGLGGNTGHFSKIVEICRDKGLKLILDAAHMSGTKLNGITPGTLADVAIYSFQAVKNLPTADSGMICFQDASLDAVSRKFAWLGINKDTYTRVGSTGSYKWEYDVEFVGNKYHGNSIIAAIGLAQLPHLDEGNVYRRRLADIYDSAFASYADRIQRPEIPEGCISSRHLYQIVVENRNDLILFLNKNGISPGVHYTDNTKYRMYRYADGSCPRARYVSEHTCSLPLHLNLSEDDVRFIAKKTIEFIDSAPGLNAEIR